MSTDYSLAFFLVQMGAAIVAYLLGGMIGRQSARWGEVLLGVATLLAIGWAMRFSAEDALLQLIPLGAMIWLEGTLIVPVFMLMVGVAGALIGECRGRRIGLMGACFGLTYLTFNGLWMLSPRVHIAPSVARASDSQLVSQSRDDTCVAAALATVLRAPGIDVQATESEMAALADVRAGRGSTMLRALRAARMRLSARDMDVRLHVCTARQVVRMASAARPALVTVRSARLGQSHMIAVYGQTALGHVIVADPASERQRDAGHLPIGKAFPETNSDYPPGLRRWDFDEFRSLYRGRAIVFIDQRPASNRLLSRR